MIKKRLEQIANIYSGYSNQFIQGKKKYSIVGIKELRNQISHQGNYFFKKETIDKLIINKKTILIPNFQNYKIFEYGQKYIGSIVGKGLYKIELINDKIPIHYLISFLKSNITNLHYEGNIVKILKINDLKNLLIPIPSKKIINLIVKLEKYQMILNKQNIDICIYIKSIFKEINEQNN